LPVVPSGVVDGVLADPVVQRLVGKILVTPEELLAD
jgi:hypothetical protein